MRPTGSPQGKSFCSEIRLQQGSAFITHPGPPGLLGDNPAQQINNVVSNNHTKDLHRSQVGGHCLSHPSQEPAFLRPWGFLQSVVKLPSVSGQKEKDKY